VARSPSPRWGWHRLDRSWAERLVLDAGIGPGDLVLDVGAGDGALTVPLLAAGARVIAIELHPQRARALRQRFADDDVVVVQADAGDLRLPRRPFRVVANPPFASTASLLRRLLGPGSRLIRADLIIQSTAARHWTDGRARGAGRWVQHYDLGLGRTIPRSAFRPAPPVGGRVLVARRREERAPSGAGRRGRGR
jgi:23S rRNA (adenine-N6)-dimethyltransferase